VQMLYMNSQIARRLDIAPLSLLESGIEDPPFGGQHQGVVAGVVAAHRRLGLDDLIGQVILLDPFAIAQHEGSLDNVPEFAHVARPLIAEQCGASFRRKSTHWARHLGRQPFQKENRQHQDVAGPLAQRRKPQRDHIQAVVEVAAETSLGDQGGEVAVGGGGQPQVDTDRPRAADALELALLQHAQQLGLQHLWQFANLVQKERAAFGQFDLASLLRKGSRERAALVPEKFSFQQILSDSRTVYGYERPSRAAAARVDGPSGEFFATASFPQNEYGRVASRDARQSLIDPPHREAVANHVEIPAQIGLQTAFFTIELVDAASIFERLGRHCCGRRGELQRLLGERLGVGQRIQIQHSGYLPTLHHRRCDERPNSRTQNALRRGQPAVIEMAEERLTISPYLLEDRAADGDCSRSVGSAAPVIDADFAAIRIESQHRSALGRHPLQHEPEQVLLKAFETLPFFHRRSDIKHRAEVVARVAGETQLVPPGFQALCAGGRGERPLAGIHKHFIGAFERSIQIQKDSTADLKMVTAFQTATTDATPIHHGAVGTFQVFYFPTILYWVADCVFARSLQVRQFDSVGGSASDCPGVDLGFKTMRRQIKDSAFEGTAQANQTTGHIPRLFLRSLAEGVSAIYSCDTSQTSRQLTCTPMLSLMRTLRRLSGSWREVPVDRSAAPLCDAPAGAPLTVWGGLQIRERISAGAFGTVYRAWDNALEREVALKLYPARAADGSRSKVVEEGRLLARLRHENIAAVYGAGVDQGFVGLWMELVRGQTLEEILAANGPLSAREAALAVCDVCHALAAVHAAGLLHRDVKAQNVMREAGGRIVLIDFGLGEERVAHGVPQELAGTPLYMAPELLGDGRATTQSEIYALGVLLFHLVSGRYPVEATTFGQLGEAHRGSRLLLRELRPELPSDFVEVVERATSADSSARYRSVAEMLPHLRSVIGARTANARKGSALLVIRGVVAVICLAVTGSGWWWVTQGRVGAHAVVWVTETIAPPGQPDYAGLTVAMREQISQSAVLRTFDGAQVPALLDRMTLPHNTRLTGPLRRELAQRAGISYIIDSTILQLGSELRLKVAMESVGPVVAIAAGRTEREFPFDDISGVSAAVQKAAEWVRREAHEPETELAVANYSPAEITTNSLGALAHFARGERLNAAGDPVQAIAEWKAALVADPDFLQAHMRLGDVLRTNGRAMESLEEYAAAYHLLDRRKLGLRESFRIRSAFLYDTGDMMAADAIHAEWAARFPEDSEPLIKRGRPLLFSGRPQQAIEALTRAETLNPKSTSAAGLLAWCHISVGDWSSAKLDTNRLRNLRWEDQAELFDATAEFLQGRVAGALRRTMEVRDRNRMKAERSGLRIDATLQAGAIWSDLGNDEQAARLLESDLSPAQSTGSPADLAREEVALASIRLRSGDAAGSRMAALAALDLESGPWILRIAGPLLAEAGGPAEALARVDAFEKKIPAGEARQWRLSRMPRLLVEGQNLLKRGRVREALQRLQEAAALDTPGMPHEFVARALEAAGERQSALAEWLGIADNYRLLWIMPAYFPPGIGRRALEKATELCGKAGNSAGTEARCAQARQRLDSLRTMVVPK
jgi:tRNA A-37 threonylcarbamoyl transferase component Bud32/tetratricopeptide (TPR) repeat protein